MGRGDLEKTQGTKHVESNRRIQTMLERARETSMALSLSSSSSPIAVANSLASLSFELEEWF